MLRLNKLTDYAIVILAQMSRDPGARHSSVQLAAATAVPEPTVSKILKDLAKLGFLTSYRGALGGYALERPADAITLREVIEAVEGPVTMVECIDPGSTCCTTEKKCPLRGRWDVVNAALVDVLDRITVEDMIRPKLVRPVHRIAAAE